MSHINRLILRKNHKIRRFFIVCIMPKPMTVNLPFPTTDGICPDALSLRIISPAYASPTGELNTVLQYIYHALVFNAKGFKEQSET
ncbi:MAG: hypothetical protein K2N30_03110, partial [Clostridia bacterium]|nr:hypothetical protein [Clostridia bacterium]